MDTHSQIMALIESGSPFAVVVVLAAEGSTPREAGVKAVVDAEGRIRGTVGGGVVEAETQRAAVEACRSGQAAILELALDGEAAADREPICGGMMRLLVDPTARRGAAAYAAAAAAVAERRRGALLTVVRGTAAIETEVTWLPEEAADRGPVEPGVVRLCLADGSARLVPGPRVQVLVEPVVPPPRLLIAGGGHIGLALATQAVLVGFEVTVFDDRPEFADPARFPEDVHTHCGDIAVALAECEVDDDTCVVIVTRGHRHDAEALRACLHRPVAYLGMMGSRRKVTMIRESFIDAGIATRQELDRVHAPIGLDIGAETVPEIAVSILAQLIAVRRKAGDRGARDMSER